MRGQHAWRRWAGPYLCVTALAVPLVYSNATIDPVLPARFFLVALLGVVTVTALAVAIVRGSTTVTVNRAEKLVVGGLCLYILVAGLSLLVHGPTPDGFLELLKLTTLVWLVYASSRAIAGAPHRLALLARFVTLALILVGGFAILQYYRVPLFEWMRRDVTVDSTMGHRNLLASYLMLGFPFVLYGFLEMRGLWRLASAIAILISMFLFVALQTRAVWVAFPLGLVSATLVLWVVTKRARPTQDRLFAYRKRAFAGVALLALGSGLALLFQYAPGSRGPMLDHAGTLVQLQHASIQERLQLWKRTLRMIQEHPLLGVGPGNWRVVLPKYGAEGLRSDTGTLHFQRPHNDFLWVASETGLLGGASYLAVLLCVLGLGVSSMARASTAHDRLVLALMFLGVSCFMLESLFSFPKERMAHTVYLALLTGTILSLHRDARGGSTARPLPRRWATSLVGCVWLVTLVAGRFAWSRYEAELHLRRAFAGRAAQDWPAMLAHLDRIDERSYTMDPTAVPVAWYRGVAHYEMGDLVAASADFRRALEVHPNHVHVLNNHATCQTLQGETEAAIHTYERAIALAPRFEDARVNLGFLLHSLGRDQEAYEILLPIAASAATPRFRECFDQVRGALGMAE